MFGVQAYNEALVVCTKSSEISLSFSASFVCGWFNFWFGNGSGDN